MVMKTRDKFLKTILSCFRRLFYGSLFSQWIFSHMEGYYCLLFGEKASFNGFCKFGDGQVLPTQLVKLELVCSTCKHDQKRSKFSLFDWSVFVVTIEVQSNYSVKAVIRYVIVAVSITCIYFQHVAQQTVFKLFEHQSCRQRVFFVVSFTIWMQGVSDVVTYVIGRLLSSAAQSSLIWVAPKSTFATQIPHLPAINTPRLRRRLQRRRARASGIVVK